MLFEFKIELYWSCAGEIEFFKAHCHNQNIVAAFVSIFYMSNEAASFLFLSFFLFRLIWLESSGGVLYGRAPPPHPSCSLWRRRIQYSAVSAAVWRPMCWVCGGDTTPRAAGNSGFSGGGTTQALLNLSITIYPVSGYIKLYNCATPSVVNLDVN